MPDSKNSVPSGFSVRWHPGLSLDSDVPNFSPPPPCPPSSTPSPHSKQSMPSSGSTVSPESKPMPTAPSTLSSRPTGRQSVTFRDDHETRRSSRTTTGFTADSSRRLAKGAKRSDTRHCTREAVKNYECLFAGALQELTLPAVQSEEHHTDDAE
eukprot:Polyplicarium_translucidae@DN388_c0_g1_i1.p1